MLIQRPVLCDILFFLTTDVRHVTGWRVKALIRVAKEKKLVHKGVARLVHQYKFLRPEVVTVYKVWLHKHTFIGKQIKHECLDATKHFFCRSQPTYFV